MMLSSSSLAFLKEQELNPDWDGLKETVNPTSLMLTDVVIKTISHCYDNVMKIELYSKKHDIWIDVICTPDHDTYIYQYDEGWLAIPNTISVSLPLEQEEDCI